MRCQHTATDNYGVTLTCTLQGTEVINTVLPPLKGSDDLYFNEITFRCEPHAPAEVYFVVNGRGSLDTLHRYLYSGCTIRAIDTDKSNSDYQHVVVAAASVSAAEYQRGRLQSGLWGTGPWADSIFDALRLSRV